MIWGCIIQEGIGYAIKIDSKMNGDLYLQILKDKLLNTLQYYGLNPSNIIFYQDNNPKYTCKKVKEWLDKQDFKTMVWLAQFSNLNPIEKACKV